MNKVQLDKVRVEMCKVVGKEQLDALFKQDGDFVVYINSLPEFRSIYEIRHSLYYSDGRYYIDYTTNEHPVFIGRS